MKYKLLSGTSADDLSIQVNDRLNFGWELYGFPQISISGSGRTYIQAVIKKENN